MTDCVFLPVARRRLDCQVCNLSLDSNCQTRLKGIDTLVTVTSTARPGKTPEMWKHLSTCSESPAAVRLQAQQSITNNQRKKLAVATNMENDYTTAGSSRGQTPSLMAHPVQRLRSGTPALGLSPLLLPSLSALPTAPSSLGATLSSSSTPSESDDRPAKRSRLSEVNPEVFYAEVGARSNVWSVEERTQWQRDLCLLFVTCNISWWAVEHPFCRAFFHKWVPDCTMPSRKQLSGRILEAEAKRVEKKMEERVGNRFGTGQCDGWKNIAKTSLVAFMVNVEYTVSLISHASITRTTPLTLQSLSFSLRPNSNSLTLSQLQISQPKRRQQTTC